MQTEPIPKPEKQPDQTTDLEGVASTDLLASAIEVCKCAEYMAAVLEAVMASRKYSLPIFMQNFGKDAVIRHATEAHYFMVAIGEYLNNCDAITEEDAKWDATFEKARALFPLANSFINRPVALDSERRPVT